VHGISGKKVA
jgi:hypothetical protein